MTSGWNTPNNGADAARQGSSKVSHTFDNAPTRQARGPSTGRARGYTGRYILGM
jgi:hypothetical protein